MVSVVPRALDCKVVEAVSSELVMTVSDESNLLPVDAVDAGA